MDRIKYRYFFQTDLSVFKTAELFFIMLFLYLLVAFLPIQTDKNDSKLYIPSFSERNPKKKCLKSLNPFVKWI